MHHPPHPVRIWMRERSVTVADLILRIGRNGRELYSPGYIRHVVTGRYKPAPHLAASLSRITGIPVADILGYPYKRGGGK